MSTVEVLVYHSCNYAREDAQTGSAEDGAGFANDPNPVPPL
jgi:hypothetical protein